MSNTQKTETSGSVSDWIWLVSGERAIKGEAAHKTQGSEDVTRGKG